ncbi:hypothetical protein MTO96_028674 [Rhipicephalus appendiculatus]
MSLGSSGAHRGLVFVVGVRAKVVVVGGLHEQVRLGLATSVFGAQAGGVPPGFYGRVLELTGTLRLTGVRPLDYQQDDAPPTAPMEVVQGMASSSTSAADEPPAAAAAEATPSERQPPTAPPRRRPVRPPRQPRARRVDLLSDMQSQCARSLEQGTDLLRVLEFHREEHAATGPGRRGEQSAASAVSGGSGANSLSPGGHPQGAEGRSTQRRI